MNGLWKDFFFCFIVISLPSPFFPDFFISINRCEKPNQGKWLAVGGEIIFLAPNILWNCSGLPIIIDNPICIWKGHVKRDFLVHSSTYCTKVNKKKKKPNLNLIFIIIRLCWGSLIHFCCMYFIRVYTELVSNEAWKRH